MRRYIAAMVAYGTVIAAATIAAAWILAHIVAGVITEPATRSLAHWRLHLGALAAIWVIRVVAQWLQARLSQRAATAAIAARTVMAPLAGLASSRMPART